MSITFLSNPIHLPEFFKFDREYLGKQESQNEDQKVFHKDTLEVSQLSKNRENLMDKIKHTVVHKKEDEYLNRNSIEFHSHQGYRLVGEFYDCGYKFKRWYNMVWMEKLIGEHTDK